MNGHQEKAIVVNDIDNLTASEVKDLKIIVNNYRVAKYGVLAVLTVGALLTAILQIAQYFKK